jgi:transcriptional regulator with XRE-family HTH domain
MATTFGAFGEMLKRFRQRRNISKYELSARSGIAHGNIFKIENHQRGVPPFGTVFSLAMGLELTEEERDLFMKRALGERLLDEVQSWCVYYYLATLRDEDFQRVMKFVNGPKPPRGAEHALADKVPEMDSDRLYAILIEIAERPEWQEERSILAAKIVRDATISLADGSVNVTLGPLAHRALDVDRLIHDNLREAADVVQRIRSRPQPKQMAT